MEQSAAKTRFLVHGYDLRRALRSGAILLVGLYAVLLLVLYPFHGGWAWEYVTGFTVTYTTVWTFMSLVIPERLDLTGSGINFKPTIGPFRRTLGTEGIRSFRIESTLFLRSYAVAVLKDGREVKVLTDVMPAQAEFVARELERRVPAELEP